MLDQEARRDEAKVETRTISLVGSDCSFNVGELLRYFGPDLITLEGDGRPHERVQAPGIVESSDGVTQNLRTQSAPTGVDDRERRARFIDNQHRNAVRDENGQGEVGGRGEEAVAFSGFERDRRVEYLIAVDLSNNDESFRCDADRGRHPAPVLGDVFHSVIHVRTEIERVIRRVAHAAEAIGNECVDAKLLKLLYEVHAERSAGLGSKSYWGWHFGQIPLSSSTWRKSR